MVMEPTRNAWVPLAAWFKRLWATVIVTPSEQSADLRDYYSKHIKSDVSTRAFSPGCHCCTQRASGGGGARAGGVDPAGDEASVVSREAPEHDHRPDRPTSSCSGRAGILASREISSGTPFFSSSPPGTPSPTRFGDWERLGSPSSSGATRTESTARMRRRG